MFEGISEGVKKLSRGVKAIQTTMKKRSDKKHRAEVKALNEQKQRREKSLPHIQKIAREYGATVSPLNSEAYVHKGKGRDEVGVHIKYGLSSDEIRARLEKAMQKGALGSKITTGVRKTVETGKSIRKAFLDSGIGGGSMYGDPKDMWKH